MVEEQRLELGAVETVLESPRIRWLTGMDRHLTERGNVYGEKVDEEQLQSLFKQAMKDEYHKALILESLKERPRSVREMAALTRLPVYMVSLRLNDLEKRGLAELKGYEETTPKYVIPAS